MRAVVWQGDAWNEGAIESVVAQDRNCGELVKLEGFLGA